MIGRPIKVVALAAAIVAASLAPLALDACHATPRPITDVIDCTKLAAPELFAESVKLEKLIPDWSAIYDAAVADAGSIGFQVAGCVLSDLAQQYLTKKSTAEDETAGNAAHAALEKFRTTKAHGATFHTAAGNL